MIKNQVCALVDRLSINIHSNVAEGEPAVIKFQSSFVCDVDGLDCEQENQETVYSVHCLLLFQKCKFITDYVSGNIL